MTVESIKMLQISKFRCRTRGPTKGRGRPRTVPVETLALKRNSAQEHFPSMAGFPVICMTAALGPDSPQAAQRYALHSKRGFPELKLRTDSIIKGRGKNAPAKALLRNVDKDRKNLAASSRRSVEVGFPFILSYTIRTGISVCCR